MLLYHALLSEYVKKLIARDSCSKICEGLADKVELDFNGYLQITAESLKTPYSNLAEKEISFIISGWISHSLKELYSPNLFLVDSYFHKKENQVTIDIIIEPLN